MKSKGGLSSGMIKFIALVSALFFVVNVMVYLVMEWKVSAKTGQIQQLYAFVAVDSTGSEKPIICKNEGAPDMPLVFSDPDEMPLCLSMAKEHIAETKGYTLRYVRFNNRAELPIKDMNNRAELPIND
ncbi:MAG: hypothetical protein H0X02_03360 [Nitrosomonas sp.]|nr:hypothetical protein [Nitrosomonas sp.]